MHFRFNAKSNAICDAIVSLEMNIIMWLGMCVCVLFFGGLNVRARSSHATRQRHKGTPYAVWFSAFLGLLWQRWRCLQIEQRRHRVNTYSAAAINEAPNNFLPRKMLVAFPQTQSASFSKIVSMHESDQHQCARRFWPETHSRLATRSITLWNWSRYLDAANQESKIIRSINA